MRRRIGRSQNAALPPTESWRRIVLENALDAVVGMDVGGTIIDWNRQAEVTFGWTKEQAIGQKLVELIIPPPYRERHNRGLERFLATGEGPILNQRIEITALHRTGHSFPVELTVIPIRVDGFHLFYSFVRDITERHKHDAFVLEAERALRASESLFRTLFEEAPFSIQLLSPDGRTLRVNRAWRRLWEIPDEIVEGYILKEYNVLTDPQLRAKGVLPFIEQAFAGEAAQAPPIYYDPAEIGQPGRPRWVKGLVYPVKSTDEKVQHVVLLHDDVSEQVVAADDQRFLAGLYIELSRSAQTERLIACTTRALAEHLKVGRCWLSEVDEASGTAEVRLDYAHGLPSLQGRYQLEAFGPEMLASWRRGRTVSVDDVVTDSRTATHSDAHMALGIRAFVTVPLHRAGAMVGALNVTREQPCAWTTRDIELVRSVAEALWSAMERTRLYQQAQDAVRAREESLALLDILLKRHRSGSRLLTASYGIYASTISWRRLSAFPRSALSAKPSPTSRPNSRRCFRSIKKCWQPANR
jgi:PAS domain S-box-containing protein